MRRATFALIATATILASGVTAQQKPQADTALQAAIRTEMVDGNLKGAIEQYRKLADGSDRAVAAQAQVRIGQCYEKLGSAQAREAYEATVRRFPEQTEAVATAQARLAAMGGVGSGPVYRQVWTGPKVDIAGIVSKDGRHLSFVDWDTGDLALHDLTTGTNRRLTNKGTWEQSSEFAERSAISRDGKQVAYAWFSSKNRYELRVASLSASGFPPSRRLLESEDISAVQPHDWSPDGRWIAVFLQRKDRTSQIGLVSTETGSLRMLRPAATESALFFSPDGRYLAFSDRGSVGNARDQDVFVIAIEGGGETKAVVNPGRDWMMGWSPDGKYLLFESDRTGSGALWGLSMADGRPQGEPVQLRPGIKADFSMGMTAAGSLFIANNVSDRDIFLASLDFETGRLLAPPVRPIDTYMGSNVHPDWSPDGKFLAYTSQHSPIGVEKVLAIRSIDTGETRELRPKLQGFNWPRWAPDGRAFICQGTDAQMRQGIYRIDAHTGEVSPIVAAPPGAIFQAPQWSPDGKRIYYVLTPRGAGETAVIERTLETGAEREIIRRKGLVGPALSPDGRYVSALSLEVGPQGITGAAILLIPTDEGEVRELVRETPEERIRYAPAWGPGGRSLIAQRFFNNGRRRELWMNPIDGGQPRKLDLEIDIVSNVVRVHPDGKRVVYMGGSSAFEVMALESFLPTGKPAK